MNDIRKYINIHPGRIIEKKLASMHISQSELATRVCVTPQELNSIIKGRRNIPTKLSLRIEKELSIEEGFLSHLQLLNSIEKIKKESLPQMAPPNIRRILFWDTDFDEINWGYSKKFVIKRVHQYGTLREIQTINEYYGI